MRVFTFLIFINFLFFAQTARAVSLGISPSPQVTQNGQTVTVDVVVTDYADIVAYQFSMTWDPAVLQFQGLSNFMSDLNASNFNTSIPGTLTVAYASNTTLPVSLPDGSVIFSIQFLAIGAGGTSSNITFGSAPTLLKFYDSALISLGVTTQSGLVNIAAPPGFSVSGNIHRISGPPVPGTTVEMTGDATGTDVTGAPGDYLFQGIAAGSDLTITPSKDVDHLECVSVRDIIFIFKHILGLMPLPNPYQMIEADVNKSGSITTFDAVEIRKLILGIYTQFPNNTSWRFVDADFVFPNPANPFSVSWPELTNIPDIQADVVQDFIGMKIGDATDCVNDAPAPAFLTLSASDAVGTAGQQVSIDVSVQGFNDVLGLQFSMEWDPAVLQFDQVNNLNLVGLVPGSLNSTSTKLSFCWNNDVFLGGLTLPDGTNIFSLQFTIIGAGSGVTPISFVQTPTKFEVVDGDCLPYNLNVNNGSVQWSGGGNSGVQLTASNTNACPGDVVCMDVSVADFENMVAGQFTLDWDPAAISFQNLQNLNPSLGLNNSHFSTAFTASGQLLFSWTDPNAIGVSLPDNAVLFQVCYEVVGVSGGVFSIDFTSSPLILEFADVSGIVPVATSSGSVLTYPITDFIICNDLIIVSLNTECEAVVDVSELLESCAGDATIDIFQSLSDPPIFSGTNIVTFDAISYVGQLLFYEVTSNASGNSCWGNILVDGNCPPDGTLCDSISTFFHDDTTGAGCCHVLQIQNQKPNYFTYIGVTVLGGGDLAPFPSAGAGWSWQGTVGNTAYFAPNAGTAPVGDYEVAEICLENLTTDIQTVEIQYYDLNFDIVCRDTLTLECDACVQTIIDSVYCESWNVYQMNFCVKAGDNLDWTIGSVSIHPPAGVTFTPDVFSLPALSPGQTYCYLTTTVTGGTPGQEICFSSIVHHEDIAAGELDLSCCTDTIPVCFTLPNCDPCDSTITYATAEQVESPTDSCCWKITLHNPPSYYIGIGVEIATPGVQFEAVNNFPGSGWNLTNWTPTGLDFMPIPPQGSFVQDGSMLPVVCIADDGSGLATYPQEVVVSWMAEDSSFCYDTLQFDCLLTNEFVDCATLDSVTLTCNPDGTFSFTFTVTNHSTAPLVTADHIHLTPAGPFTANPSDFYLNLPPGATSPPLTTIITGSPTGGAFNFFVSLHEINDDSLHLNCCTTDTIAVQIDDQVNPTISCINGLVANLLLGSPPSVTIWATDFILSAQDNCTPFPMLTFGIRIVGTGTGFPTGQVNQIFTCNEVGTQQVEIWVMDEAGNTDFCQTFVVIQDNIGLCPVLASNSGEAFQLFQNQPNPWSEETVIGFYLPEASTATLTVFDAVGRARFTNSGEFKKGNNSFQLDSRVTEEGGMLYYRVETPAASATMRMVQEK